VVDFPSGSFALQKNILPTGNPDAAVEVLVLGVLVLGVLVLGVLVLGVLVLGVLDVELVDEQLFPSPREHIHPWNHATIHNTTHTTQQTTAAMIIYFFLSSAIPLLTFFCNVPCDGRCDHCPSDEVIHRVHVFNLFGWQFIKFILVPGRLEWEPDVPTEWDERRLQFVLAIV
jgi:hypothetical protein